jgi:MoaA/NifB/PqqE/SkfB family radical SAM enzyme
LGKGFLRAEKFRKLLQDNPSVRWVELSNWGEVFLNPQIADIFRIAYEAGVTLTIRNGANLNNCRDDALEALVKYGVRAMTCSIDGASQSTYEVYRRAGDFDTVIENIKKINYYKRRYFSIFPILKWQYVVFGHNEHEIATARKLAKQLGMHFSPKLSWDQDFSPVRDADLVKRATGLKAVSRAEYKDQTKTVYLQRVCEELWDTPQLNFDGRVLGCGANTWAFFEGNGLDNLGAAYNSKMMNDSRAMLTGQIPAVKGNPCTDCGLYKERVALKQWVKPDSFQHRRHRWLTTAARKAGDFVFACSHALATMRQAPDPEASSPAE